MSDKETDNLREELMKLEDMNADLIEALNGLLVVNYPGSSDCWAIEKAVKKAITALCKAKGETE